MNREIIAWSAVKLDNLEVELANAARSCDFQMESWGNTTERAVPGQEDECGFAGCWAGWAAHRGWYDKFGWQLVLWRSDSDRVMIRIAHSSKLWGSGMTLRKLAQMLDVRLEIVERIALPEFYDEPPSVGEVAARFRFLLIHGEDLFMARFAHSHAEPEPAVGE